MGKDGGGGIGGLDDMQKAAGRRSGSSNDAEIARLQAEVARLRAGFERICEPIFPGSNMYNWVILYRRIAHEALTGKTLTDEYDL